LSATDLYVLAAVGAWSKNGVAPVRIFADKLGLPTTLLKQGKNKRSLDVGLGCFTTALA
jgi:hypothetical protein